MSVGLSDERGSVSFFALCFLGASLFMALGLLHIARQGETAIRYHEAEVQLRLDAEGYMEKMIERIESRGLEMESTLPIGEETALPQEKNERDVTLRAAVKRAGRGMYLIAIAETNINSAVVFKSLQCFLERKEEGYVWKCWIP